MVRISVEITTGPARRRVSYTSVRGRSIAGIVRSLEYAYGEGNVRVIFPIDGERFFVEPAKVEAPGEVA
jgi:hypothetical protein